MRKVIFAFVIMILLFGCAKKQLNIQIDNAEEWGNYTASSENVIVKESDNLNDGVIDLMGNGALMLEKQDKENLFQKSSVYQLCIYRFA